MIKRMSKRCYKVYAKVTARCHGYLPTYLRDMSHALYNLDEKLTEYEQNDLAFTKEYTSLSKQWSDAEKLFYKMLKMWCKMQ